MGSDPVWIMMIPRCFDVVYLLKFITVITYIGIDVSKGTFIVAYLPERPARREHLGIPSRVFTSSSGQSLRRSIIVSWRPRTTTVFYFVYLIVRCQTKVHNKKYSYLCWYFILLFSKILLLIEFRFIVSLILLLFSPYSKYTSLGIRLSSDLRSLQNYPHRFVHVRNSYYLYIMKQKSSSPSFTGLLLGPYKVKLIFFYIGRIIDWAPIRSIIEIGYTKDHKSIGRPSYDSLMLFKTELLRTWYGQSDGEIEDQVNSRLSFSRFVGLGLADAALDSTTVYRFWNTLVEAILYDAVLSEINC